MSAFDGRHIPVLGRQAVELLAPRAGGIYVDGTFGAGGYSAMLLEIPGTRVIGIDRDRTAIAGGFDLVDQSAGRLTLVQDRFSNLAEICTARGEGLVEVDRARADERPAAQAVARFRAVRRAAGRAGDWIGRAH